jgi:AraC-like DNA-binding protein
MILAFHPTHPEMPGEMKPVPAEWRRFLSPWANAVFRENDFGFTLIQELLTEEYGIYSWRLEVKSAVRLYPAAATPTIALQFTLGENIPCKLSGFGDKLLEKGRQEMFYVPIGFNEAWFEPGSYESFHIELKPHYLEELVEIRPEIKELVSRLQVSSSKGMPMSVVGINYVTYTTLQHLKACNKKGPGLRLEMHKYILELLCEYLEAIQRKEQDARGTHIQHRELILRIKDHILSAPNVHEHTPKKLARKFGISESILRRAFKAYAGMAISSYVRMVALAKGEYLLTATKLTIDEIADELGYGWRQAFGDAFKKQYHYSPNDWRNVQDSSKI